MDQAHKLRVWFGFGDEADEDRHDEVGGEGEDGSPEVLRHVTGVVMDDSEPATVDAGGGFNGQGEAVVEHGCAGPGDEAGEGLLKLDGEFAAATPQLIARAPEFQATLEAALNFTKPQFNESMRAGRANM